MYIYKSLKLFVLVFFIATVAFFAGCGGGTTPPITPDLPDLEEEYNTIDEIGGSAAEEYLNFEDTYGEEQALQNTVDYLNQQEGIENVFLDEESGTISFEFENGHLGIIITYDVTQSLRLEAGKGEPPLPIEGIKHLLKGTPTKKKALLLNPLPTIFGNSTQYIKGKLEAIGYQCDYYEGEAVTVELMKNMEEYGIIYIDTHGGVVNSYNYGKEIYFVVGQKGNKQLYEKYASDLQFLRLAHFWVPSFSLSHYFAILPHFIGEYAETSYPNSLIYIDACNSYKNPTMAQAFIDEGSYVYCGYSSFITAINESEQTVFDNMIDEAMTIQEAVNGVGASNLHFHPGEGGNFYLVEEVDDETKIINTIRKLYQALSDQDWDEARSCCVYGTEVYESLNEAEEQFYWDNLDVGGTLDFSYSSDNYEIVVNGEYAEAYCDTTALHIVDGEVIDEISGGVWWYLQKIGNDWKIYDGLGSWDEDKIRSVCNKLISALNNKNWNEARSYCIYGSEAYNQINGLEDDVNNCESLFGPGNLNINVTINNVTIDGREALVSGYFSYIFTAGTYVEENSGSVAGCLEKIGDNWKVYEGIIPDF